MRYLVENPFKTAPYHAEPELCIACGRCQQVCPAGIIEMKDGKPVWTKPVCHMCMACLNHCPTEAIQYGEYSEGKYRYLFRGFDLSRY